LPRNLLITNEKRFGYRITIGGEFGHEVVSRIRETDKKVTDFKIGDRNILTCGLLQVILAEQELLEDSQNASGPR
jgi:hypothetical protein